MSADKWCARTDLALETQESLKKANTDMRGVNFSEKKLDNGIIVSVVTIDSENAVRATGRPKGKYVTIEAAMLSEGDEECCQAVTRELSRELKSFVKAVCDKRIYAALVVGLGNRNVTPDALAARSTKRLGCTIQLTDTGIVPGSGVGNHRDGINHNNLGVPVIAIGIPTVIDAVTIVSDAVNASRENTAKLMSPKLNGMFVTPKDIDETVKRLAGLLSEGINMAFSNDEYDDYSE